MTLLDNPDFYEGTEGWIRQAQKSTNGHGKPAARQALERRAKGLPDPEQREGEIFLLVVCVVLVVLLAVAWF